MGIVNCEDEGVWGIMVNLTNQVKVFPMNWSDLTKTKTEVGWYYKIISFKQILTRILPGPDQFREIKFDQNSQKKCSPRYWNRMIVFKSIVAVSVDEDEDKFNKEHFLTWK